MKSVGSTPVRDLTIEGIPKDVRVRLKDESTNPYGTHKDRRSKHILESALSHGINTVALITAGNAGYSLAQFVEGTSLNVVSIVDRTIRPSIRAALEGTSSRVIQHDLSSHELKPRDVVALARSKKDEKIWDVSNGFEEAYEDIIAEIADDPPSAMIVPVGSGELFRGLEKGIGKYGLLTKLFGVGVEYAHSKADKLYAAYIPGRASMEQAMQRGYEYTALIEDEVQWSIDHAPNDLRAEPSALVVFSILQLIARQYHDVMLINSGKGLE